MSLLIYIPTGAEYTRETMLAAEWHSRPDNSPLDTAPTGKGAQAVVDGVYTTYPGTWYWSANHSFSIDYGYPDAISPTEFLIWTRHGSNITTTWYGVNYRNPAIYKSNDGYNWTLVQEYDNPPLIDHVLNYTSFELEMDGSPGSARFWKIINQGPSGLAFNPGGLSAIPSDIQPNVSAPLTPVDELWAHWTMDDVSGGFVNEEQNQFKALIQNAPSQDAGDKKVGTHSMNFVRTNSDYLEVLHSRLFNLSTNGRSVSFWIKPATVTPSFYGIIQKGATDDNNNFKEWQIYIAAEELFAEMVDYTGNTVRREKLNTTITAGEWVHIAVAFTGITSEDEIKIWKNKVQGNELDDKDATKTIDPTVYKKHNVNIGRFRRSGILRYYDGKIDDMRFYGKAINQFDVNTLPGF